MTIVVAGIDCGFTKGNPSAIALVKFDGSPIRPRLVMWEVLIPFDGRWEGRVQDVCSAARSFFGAYKNNMDMRRLALVSVEQPFVGADTENIQTSIKLAAVMGGMFMAAHPHPVMAVLPSQGKKALARNGGATKAQMVEAARILFGEELSPHVADACGIALAGALLSKLVKP